MNFISWHLNFISFSFGQVFGIIMAVPMNDIAVLVGVESKDQSIVLDYGLICYDRGMTYDVF